nr:PREDICTED: antizyme inhibitor 1-like [Latimeria chalumnae]|eukprot:XP_014347866.1 PREDICTED: antizyme inhibitor 1-like [Latimeria chalumnae]
MAQIKPFYTVKCNTSLAVVEILAALGTGFSCASKNEIVLVQSLGVAPESIIYTNPCKQVSQIKYAAKSGVEVMTCDNEGELMKIARNHPSAKLLLHIATEDTNEEMSMKFGATLKSCRHLLESAKELGVQVIGVKFQISSSYKDPQAYAHALSDARYVFDMAEELGFNMSLLDVGDGFSGTEFQLKEIYSFISPLLDIYFPRIKVIAEPGSYYVTTAFTLAVNIIAKKVVSRDKFNHSQEMEPSMNDKPAFIYYMNDGVYGSFANKLMENFNVIPIVHKKYNEEGTIFASSLWGPSSDGLDQVVEHCVLPELNVGDWVIFENMGANTLGQQSTFSEVQRPPLYYLMSVSDWYEMHEAGITRDTSLKNFFFVPSCFLLS